MKHSFSKIALAISATASLLAGEVATPAMADPAIGVAVVAPITPATLGAAAAVAVVANELASKKPFGPNGEGMKAATAVVKAPGNLVRQWFPHW